MYRQEVKYNRNADHTRIPKARLSFLIWVVSMCTTLEIGLVLSDYC